MQLELFDATNDEEPVEMSDEDFASFGAMVEETHAAKLSLIAWRDRITALKSSKKKKARKVHRSKKALISLADDDAATDVYVGSLR